ncbi:hypothetical protein pb186bvf_008956 [Paramecium bursaria]
MDNWMLKCKYLQTELDSIKMQLSDARTLIQLNKEQLKVCYNPNQFNQDQDSKAALVLLKFVMQENEFLTKKIDQLSQERNHAVDRAFINQQITESTQRQEQDQIQQLYDQIKELKQKLEYQQQYQSEQIGVIYIEKNIFNPEFQSMIYTNQIQKMNNMLLKYRLDIGELQEQKNDLAQLNFSLSNEILKMKTQRFTPKGQGRSFFGQNEDPQRFMQNLVQLQKKLFFDEEEMEEKDQLYKSGVFSPLFSPVLPQKVRRQASKQPPINIDHFIPRLDLAKAQQIQQYNIKRIQLMQSKIQSDGIESKLLTLQEELLKTRNKYHVQLVLNQQLDLAVTEYQQKLEELQGVNEILIKSNKQYEEKWIQLFQQFQFYKDFYLNYKDQIIHQKPFDFDEFSIIEMEKAMNISKRNKTSNKINPINTGVSIINYNDDHPYSQHRMPTERYEDNKSMKKEQYKQYLVDIAKDVFSINLTKVENKKNDQQCY